MRTAMRLKNLTSENKRNVSIMQFFFKLERDISAPKKTYIIYMLAQKLQLS